MDQKEAIAGVWTGTYSCTQGETGLRLAIEPSGKIEFSFYPVNSGSHSATGKYQAEAVFIIDTLGIAAKRWIERPGRYDMVNLLVRERTATTMRGEVLSRGCTTFSVSRNR
ncbi:hypothetical protein [Nocardia callitridis]|uniref:hypothetical protein n=1 Tax=Nocardia callitridis TaxID=648753 RepID=UPI0031ED5D8F